jgi:hypothetical protein
MINRKWWAYTTGLMALTLAPVAANAGLIGFQVDVATFFPTTAHVISDGGVKTVGASVEYPAGSFPSYNLSASVDLTNDQMIITGRFGGFSAGTFNGFGLSGPVITNAVTDAASTLDPVSLSIVGGELFVNFQGLPTSGATTTIIDVTTAASSIPEPSTWTLMALGFAGLGFAGYRSRRGSVSIAA